MNRALALGGLTLALVLVVQPRRLMRVVGSSMAPTYADGEWLTTLPVDRELRRGDVVVLASPQGPLVKRVALLAGERHLQFKTLGGWREMALLFAFKHRNDTLYRSVEVPEGTIYVTGDHLTMSIDSRDFGPVPLARVLRIVEDVRPPHPRSDVVAIANPAWRSS